MDRLARQMAPWRVDSLSLCVPQDDTKATGDHVVFFAPILTEVDACNQMNSLLSQEDACGYCLLHRKFSPTFCRPVYPVHVPSVLSFQKLVCKFYTSKLCVSHVVVEHKSVHTFISYRDYFNTKPEHYYQARNI
jgi:hypothetical protein